MEPFVYPEYEIVVFESEDVITASGCGEISETPPDCIVGDTQGKQHQSRTLLTPSGRRFTLPAALLRQRGFP